MPTPAELEQIARNFCIIRGLDPDELVILPTVHHFPVIYKEPRWRGFVKLAQDHVDMAKAVRMMNDNTNLDILRCMKNKALKPRIKLKIPTSQEKSSSRT